MKTIDTVKRIYEAFGRGDVPAILEHVAEDVDWEYGAVDAGVPWLQRRRGREGVASFFASLAGMALPSLWVGPLLITTFCVAVPAVPLLLSGISTISAQGLMAAAQPVILPLRN